MDYRSDTVSEVPRPTDTVTVSRTARGKDSAYGFIGGMLWRATDALSLGATYKRQPSFDYVAALETSAPIANTPADFVTDAVFNIPDSLSFGISINPVDQATLNLDANRVYYTQINEDFVDYITSGGEQTDIQQELSDVTEIHLGFEWVFLSLANPLSLRLGYWLDPYHAPVNSVEDSQILGGTVATPTLRDIFFLEQFTQDTNHYAVGLGWTFGLKLQVDLAYEYSERSSNGTLSGIYRF
jgi:long-subunit fatty acid transport protein